MNRKFLFILSFIVFFSCGSDFETLKVKSFSPECHSKIADNNSVIKVEFNNDIDKEDLENRFILSGENGAIEGTFIWENGSRFIFTPRFPLEDSTRYTFEISKSVRDKNGNQMDSDFVSDFYVGEDFVKPEVLLSIPAYSDGGTMNVAIDQNIEIDFSEPMNKMKTESAFSITPNVPGYFQWESISDEADRKLRYILTAEMDYGVQYKFSILNSAEDKNGNNLLKDYSIIFITGDDFDPPEIQGVHDADDSTPIFWDRSSVNEGVDKKINISIVFSEPMKRKESEGSFSMVPSVSGKFQWQSFDGGSDRRMIFIPDKNLDLEKIYQIKIDKTAEDLNGLKPEEQYDIVVKINNANSLFVRVGSIWGSHENVSASYTLLNRDTWPVNIEMGTAGNYIYFLKIQFINLETPYTSVKMNKYSIFDNNLIEGFGENEPVIEDIQWESDGSDSIARIKVTGLSNDLNGDAELFRLTIVGGENGISDQNENNMKEDLILEFRE